MPTGYTYGIIDGSVNTFKEFATKCMRNFGALIHMRDDPSKEPYRKRTPSNYHLNALKKAQTDLKNAQTRTDDKLISSEKILLRDEIKRLRKRIEETKMARIKLEAILEQANEYKAPTDDHKGIKKFMIEQLTSTIEQDGSCPYSVKALATAEEQMKNLNPAVIRAEKIEDATKDIQYHTKELASDVDRCTNSNEWANTFLKSIE